MTIAAVYCRISEDRAGAGLGVARQREDCEALASRIGWAVGTCHVDNDISAYSGRRRPGYEAMLAELEAGAATAVLAWHPDRLHRSPRELERFIDVCERRHVAVATVQAGELDLSTPTGRMSARIVGAVARHESEHKAQRIARAYAQTTHAGRWPGGTTPYGWTLQDGNLIVDPAAAAVLREVARDVLAGVSLRSIARELNERGVATSRGKQWTGPALRDMLRRPRNVGLAVLHGETVGNGRWNGILTEETWRGVCAILADPTRKTSTGNQPAHLLSGIAVCGFCGVTMAVGYVRRSKSRPELRRLYRCQGCRKANRDAQPLDEYIAGIVVSRLSRPDAADLLLDKDRPDLAELAEQAGAFRARLDELATSYADGVITASQLHTGSERLRAKLSDVEAVQSTHARAPVLTGLIGAPDVGEAWQALTLDRRRAVVRTLLHITVLKGRPGIRLFDPATVRVEWRAS